MEYRGVPNYRAPLNIKDRGKNTNKDPLWTWINLFTCTGTKFSTAVVLYLYILYSRIYIVYSYVYIIYIIFPYIYIIFPYIYWYLHIPGYKYGYNRHTWIYIPGHIYTRIPISQDIYPIYTYYIYIGVQIKILWTPFGTG